MNGGFLLSVVRMCVPLIFASLGGMFSERSGVINIALEGLMLVGAFSGAVITLTTGSPMAGFLGAGLAGALCGLGYGLSVIHGRANQVVAGTALNLLVMGMIPMLLKLLYESTGGTPSLPASSRFEVFPLWFAFLVAGFVWFLMKRTVLGLRLSFAGENPEALDAAGVSVNGIRYIGVGLSGLLAGWGGASLSLFLASGYSRNMVAGRGFMALAALILGKWRPAYAVAACLFFGLMDALQIRLQGVSLGGVAVPGQLVQMVPYLATILVLAGLVGSSKPPKALGRVFETE
jgi:general nucleoside transport system permease protein